MFLGVLGGKIQYKKGMRVVCYKVEHKQEEKGGAAQWKEKGGCRIVKKEKKKGLSHLRKIICAYESKEK